MMVSSRDGSLEKNDSKASLIGKPKLNGSENKKHRISESKTSNSFHDLFGPPIKTAPVKISPDSKKTSQSDKNVASKPPAVIEKPDKLDKTIKAKESLHRDSRRDKVDDKKDKKIRDSSKDQLKSKERSKKDLPSPGSKSHSSPGSKRPPSPVAAVKKPSTPPPPSAKHSLSPKSKEKEVKKSMEKEKDSKDKDKTKSNSKSDVMTSDSSKSERKKEKKRHKDDKDKERKDKYKEADKVASTVKDVNVKTSEKKPERTDKMEKSEKEKSQEYKSSSKDGRRSPKPSKENDKVKDDKAMKVERPDKSDKPEKVKDGKNDKERQKHKHKKRDKKDKRDSKDREKKEKRERSKEGGEKQNHAPSSATSGNALSVLLTEMPEKDSSDSVPSDDSLPESKNMLKKDTEPAMSTTPVVELTKPLSPGISMDTKRDKSDRGGRRDKSKRSEEKESRKRKRNKEDGEEISAKRPKSTSPPLEPVSSSQSPVAMDAADIDAGVHHAEKDARKDKDFKKDDRVDVIDQVASDKDMDAYVEQVAPDSTNSTDVEVNEPPIFSEDYVSQLKDLQRKIMTLQDNQELQRVVQLIAETGQYEITKKTFDFDLCALDRRTVQRLQQFFSAS